MINLKLALARLRAAAASTEEPSVLLIEDDHNLAKVCQHMLRGTCKLTVAANESEAIRLYKKELPTLVVTDSAGFSAVKKLQQAGYPLSVLIYSGSSNVPEKTKELRALDGKVKPVGSIAEFRGWVQHWLQEVTT